MKFSIALGLLLAGLAHSQELHPAQTRVDTFLRQTQHLKSSAKLVSAKENGSVSTVTYQDGPMSTKYEVKTDNNDMKIVGIEQVISFSGNLQVPQPSVQAVPHLPNGIQLPPLPLVMPQFNIESNGQITSRNVFDQVGSQIEEMQKKMVSDRQSFQQMMEQKRFEMQQRFIKDFDKAWKQTPLIGGGDHDFNEATNIQFDQPLIGGEHDYNWATEVDMNEDHPLVGGNHDFTWMAVEINPQPLLGADGHDLAPELIPQGPLIGGGDHDYGVENKRKWHHNFKNQKEYQTAKGKHNRWGRHEGRQQRHHSGMAWMNKLFTKEEITPLLKEKLPEMMKDASIISIQNKGFERGQGFPLDVQIKDKEQKIQNVSVYFKPRKQELLIDKISPIEKVQSSLDTGKMLVERFMKGLEENIMPVELDQVKTVKPKEIPAENLVAPKFITLDKKTLLQGGKQDIDNKPEFLKIAKEIQFVQNNHITHEKSEPQVLQVPLLGGQTDPDHKVESTPLLGGQSDPDHVPKVAQKTEKKSENVFDVTGLPLPGGQTDIDHKIGLDLVKKVVEKIVADISEEDVEDIDEVEEPKQNPKSEKLQLLIK